MSQSTPSKRMAPQQGVAATMADTGAEDRLERHLMRQRGAGYVHLVISEWEASVDKNIARGH